MRTLTVLGEMYRVRMRAYCGMSYDLATDATLKEALARAARFVASQVREGMTVSRPMEHSVEDGGGLEWEIVEPEDAAMIPDTAGLLSVEREHVPAWQCPECGSVYPKTYEGPCCE